MIKEAAKTIAPAIVVQAVVAPADWTSSRVNISVFSFLEETNKYDATLTGDKIPVWNAATHAKFNAERLYLLLLSSHFLLLSDYICFLFVWTSKQLLLKFGYKIANMVIFVMNELLSFPLFIRLLSSFKSILAISTTSSTISEAKLAVVVAVASVSSYSRTI